MTTRTVHLVVSAALLLSGSLDSCLGPDDPTCQGGVAAAAAFARAYSQGAPLLFLAFLDKESPFVHMCQQGWSVNRLVLQYLVNAKAFLSPPSILLQNKGDLQVSNRDISNLQSHTLPLLLSNVMVPLVNSWSPYTIPIFYDATTGLAILSIVNSDQPYNIPQISAVLGGLDDIARVNTQNGCDGDYVHPFQQFFNTTTTTTTTTTSDQTCWISVVLYTDLKEKFDEFLVAVLEHENPPDLILDLEENSEPLNQPRRVGTKNASTTTRSTWLISYGAFMDNIYQHQVITLTPDLKSIDNVQLIHHELNFSYAPANARDAQYNSTITTLANLAQDARLNDPILAYSEEVPIQRENNYRRCAAGQCEVGSLFMDAQQWWTSADFAFANSGGFRGSGWPSGAIRISNIWNSLPFPNNLCEGIMSGVSVFQLFNYSTSMATYEGEDTHNGGLLLQISGARLTYNTELTESRLISVDMWDRNTSQYLPLERLKLYKFVTDSYMCSGHPEYTDFSNSALVFPGEVKGVVDPTVTQQEVVAEYLLRLNATIFVPSVNDRMFNDTLATNYLDLVQTEASCTKNMFWNANEYTCIPCPNRSGVVFLTPELVYDGEKGSDQQPIPKQFISFVNTLPHTVTVVSRSSPYWVKITSDTPWTQENGSSEKLFKDLEPGTQVILGIEIDMEGLEAGTAIGSVLFGAVDEQNYPGCTRPDASFGVIARIDPPHELNQLGNLRYVGWGLSFLIIITSLFLSAWVLRYRNTRIVRTLQPSFLIMISTGVLVMGSSLIPLGFDDEIVSTSACSSACMAFPWLLSIGFTIAMSALFSKLWRINRLFGSGLRRVTVTARDVMAPFIVLFTLNFAAMLTWNIVDPLEWVRHEMNGQRWQTYGVCRPSDGTVALVMLIIVAVVNVSTFLVACYQAFRARNISDEFSESKSLGIALFSWVQLMMVGIPVIFLIDPDNPSAKYFINSGLIFAVCMSMLLLIYVPIIIQKQKVTYREDQERARSSLYTKSIVDSIDNTGTHEAVAKEPTTTTPTIMPPEMSDSQAGYSGSEEGDLLRILEETVDDLADGSCSNTDEILGTVSVAHHESKCQPPPPPEDELLAQENVTGCCSEDSKKADGLEEIPRTRTTATDESVPDE